MSAQNLVDLFQAMTQNLQQDRQHLNSLDRHDGDVGDNMAENFQLVTNVLSQTLGQGGQQDVGAALQHAARVLQQQGHGKTAPIYAQGLTEAGQRLAGQSGFSLTDLLPLLQGLLMGTQQASGHQQGQGSMLDALLPGIMGYMSAKQSGASDMQALLQGLMGTRRGAFGTSLSPNGFGRYQGTNTQGQIDPGAAGASSLLEGLFGGLLGGALGQTQPRQRSVPQQRQQPQLGGDLGDLLGGFFGGGDQSPSPRSGGGNKGPGNWM